MSPRPQKVLMLCLGNICRSPAAEGLFRARFPAIHFESRGTGSWHVGEHADPRSRNVCQRHKTPIDDHKARQLHWPDGEDFDLILCMDASNITDAKRILKEKDWPKIKPIDAEKPVADPYYDAKEGFERMYQHLSQCADAWAEIWRE